MSNCTICKVKLDQPGKPETGSCGGDCAKCMVTCGDPDVARSLVAELIGQRDEESNRLDFMSSGRKDIGTDIEFNEVVVYEIRGNLNDSQWNEIGRGATLRDAIDDAMENCAK